MNKKPLLQTDSLLYLRRLTRELTLALDGFYASTSTGGRVRCNRARLVNGTLQVHSFSCSPEWFDPKSYDFTDAYGRDIVASRKSGK